MHMRWIWKGDDVHANGFRRVFAHTYNPPTAIVVCLRTHTIRQRLTAFVVCLHKCHDYTKAFVRRQRPSSCAMEHIAGVLDDEYVQDIDGVCARQ